MMLSYTTFDSNSCVIIIKLLNKLIDILTCNNTLFLCVTQSRHGGNITNIEKYEADTTCYVPYWCDE